MLNNKKIYFLVQILILEVNKRFLTGLSTLKYALDSRDEVIGMVNIGIRQKFRRLGGKPNLLGPSLPETSVRPSRRFASSMVVVLGVGGGG